jgi:hypothetical protein
MTGPLATDVHAYISCCISVQNFTLTVRSEAMISMYWSDSLLALPSTCMKWTNPGHHQNPSRRPPSWRSILVSGDECATSPRIYTGQNWKCQTFMTIREEYGTGWHTDCFWPHEIPCEVEVALMQVLTEPRDLSKRASTAVSAYSSSFSEARTQMEGRTLFSRMCYYYGLDVRGSILCRGKRFFSTPQRRDWLWSPASFLSNVCRRFFLRGVKRQGREADHYPPTIAEVKNDGAMPPLPHMSSWHSA